jgi:hypothetical protein
LVGEVSYPFIVTGGVVIEVGYFNELPLYIKGNVICAKKFS